MRIGRPTGQEGESAERRDFAELGFLRKKKGRKKKGGRKMGREGEKEKDSREGRRTERPGADWNVIGVGRCIYTFGGGKKTRRKNKERGKKRTGTDSSVGDPEFALLFSFAGRKKGKKGTKKRGKKG